MINDHLMSHGMPETPWGGYKQSSIGRCHGELGFFEVTQAKVIVDDIMHRSPRNFWWLPYEDHLEEGILGGRLRSVTTASSFPQLRLIPPAMSRGTTPRSTDSMSH